MEIYTNDITLLTSLRNNSWPSKYIIKIKNQSRDSIHTPIP